MKEHTPPEEQTPGMAPLHHDHSKEAEITPPQHATAKTHTLENDRLITALAGVHSSGRDVAIHTIEPVGTHLFFVAYTYTQGGTAHTGNILVYDNGENTQVFGGR